MNNIQQYAEDFEMLPSSCCVDVGPNADARCPNSLFQWRVSASQGM